MNSNTSKNSNVHEEANRLFAKSLLLVCVFVMLTSAVARFFGILWFQADLTIVQEPSDFVVEATFVLLKLFELLFVYKILCKTKWKWCFSISVLHILIVGFFKGTIIADLLDLLFILFVPVFFNYDNIKVSLRDNAIFYGLGLAYSATYLFSKVGIVYDAKRNFALHILGLVDYKMFFVLIYLVVKLYGGIKLWKEQKKPFFKTKDQSNK